MKKRIMDKSIENSGSQIHAHLLETNLEASTRLIHTNNNKLPKVTNSSFAEPSLSTSTSIDTNSSDTSRNYERYSYTVNNNTQPTKLLPQSRKNSKSGKVLKPLDSSSFEDASTLSTSSTSKNSMDPQETSLISDKSVLAIEVKPNPNLLPSQPHSFTSNLPTTKEENIDSIQSLNSISSTLPVSSNSETFESDKTKVTNPHEEEKKHLKRELSPIKKLHSQVHIKVKDPTQGDADHSNLMPIGFVELPHVRHYKTKLSNPISPDALQALEKKSREKSASAISLERGAKNKDIYSFSENTQAFVKGKFVTSRTHSSSHSILSEPHSTSTASPTSTTSPPGTIVLENNGLTLESHLLSDPVHFQIDASHKIIFTSLSSLNLNGPLKIQIEQMLRTQMLFIHEAYKSFLKSTNEKTKAFENEIEKLKDEIKGLKLKTYSTPVLSTSKGLKRTSRNGTPLGSLFEMCRSVKNSVDTLNVSKSVKSQDIEAIRKENEQLHCYLEALISRILEYPEALDVLSVTPQFE